MKTCCHCHAEKTFDQFYVKNKSKGTIASDCIDCRRAWNRAHYARTRSVYLTKSANRNRQVRKATAIELGGYLRDHPCVDCGESNILVLEFDHRDRATKTESIGTMLSRNWSWSTILNEIQKCDVRCANCHRIRTSGQLGWRKLLTSVV